MRVERYSRWVGATLLCALIAIPNLLPLHQLRDTGGYLFYANAFDEPTYLSYDGARGTKSLTRLSEYVVIGLHRLGISGGYINLLFDVVVPASTVAVLYALARELRFTPLESVVYPFVLVTLPIIFGYTNPYYARLFDLNYASRGLFWMTLPQAYYPPFFRTPEPQVSLLIVSTAAWVAVRWQSFLPAVAVIPVVYPFVGIPYLFIVASLWYTARRRALTVPPVLRLALAAIMGYITIALAISAYYRLFVAGTTLADFLPATRLPLISGTGVVALVLYMLGRSRFDPTERTAAFFVALAPLAAANTQLVSGVLQQPNNIEQNFGVIAIGIVLVLWLRAIAYRSWMPLTGAIVVLLLLCVYSAQIFAVNRSVWQHRPPPPELLDALRQEPSSVVITDPNLADLFSLASPTLRFSAFAASQTVATSERSAESSTESRFENYLCAKRVLSSDREASVLSAIDVLDRRFRYLNQDFPLTHSKRRQIFTQYFDPTAAPKRCATRRFLVFPSVSVGQELGPLLLAGNITTAALQWAYASTAEVPTTDSNAGRLANARIELTVASGCLGLGVSAGNGPFENQVSVEAGPMARVVDLPFVAKRPSSTIVVYNCSASAASRGIIHDARLQLVSDVELRPVGEDPRVDVP